MFATISNSHLDNNLDNNNKNAWQSSTPTTAETFTFDYIMLESWEKSIFVNTTSGGSWPSQQSHHSLDQIHNDIMGQL